MHGMRGTHLETGTTTENNDGELARDDGLSAEQELMRVMRSTLDRLQQEMIKIFTRLKDLNATFGFLLDTVHLMEVEHRDSTDATPCQN